MCIAGYFLKFSFKENASKYQRTILQEPVSVNLNVLKCPPSRDRAGNPTFCHPSTVPAFLIKHSETFPRDKDILCAERVRKHTQHTARSNSGTDQMVNTNTIVRGPK